MDPLIWSVLLLIGGIGLIFLEIFIPSGGVLGFLAAIAIVASIIVAFTASTNAGLIMLVASVILVPSVLGAAIKWWPSTPMGRVLLLIPPENEADILPDTEEFRELDSMIGRRGVARGEMLPSGRIVIDDRAFDAVTEGMAVEAGQAVRVTAVKMNRLVVRIDDNIAGDFDAENLLDRPADSLGLNSLDETTD